MFCGLFPVDADDFEKLRESISKLRLNDASFSFEMETSAALGFGFRCGFLGLLHLEIIQERLTREYDLDLITTAPSVVYQIELTHGAGHIELHNPADMPDPNKIESIAEPWIEATIYCPDEYLGSILKLCQDRRGIQKNLTYVGGRAQVTYELPLNEVVFDFYDRLKSLSKGYASFDYHQIGYREGDLVKMGILVNEEPVDALSMIVHRGTAEVRGRGMVERLKELIPRHSVQDPDPGGDRRQGDRARDDQRDAQGRDREMLWRRRDPQAQAARQAEEGQGEDARIRQREHPAGGVYRGAQDGRRKLTPRELIDVARIPGTNDELRLFRRGGDFMIVLDRNELMNSRMSGSEEALATMTAERLGGARRRIWLIGGYGMGFTLRAALAVLGDEARVTVAELVPEIIDWARGPMAELAAGASTIRASRGARRCRRADRDARGDYDAILLDVDNGPDGLTRREQRAALFQPRARCGAAALTPGGVLAIWSAAPDPRFARRLGDAGFAVDEVVVRARSNGKGPRHVIWFGVKR